MLNTSGLLTVIIPFAVASAAYPSQSAASGDEPKHALTLVGSVSTMQARTAAPASMLVPSRTDADRIADLLGLTDESRALLFELRDETHADARRMWVRTAETVQDIRRASIAEGRLSRSLAEQLFRAERRAEEHFERLRTRFLGDVATLTPGDTGARSALVEGYLARRSCVVTTPGDPNDDVDLRLLLKDAGVDAEQIQADTPLAAALDAWDRSNLRAIGQRDGALNKLAERTRTMLEDARLGGTHSLDQMLQYEEHADLRALFDDLLDSHVNLVRVNDDAAEQLAALLGPASEARFTALYTSATLGGIEPIHRITETMTVFARLIPAEVPGAEQSFSPLTLRVAVTPEQQEQLRTLFHAYTGQLARVVERNPGRRDRPITARAFRTATRSFETTLEWDSSMSERFHAVRSRLHELDTEYIPRIREVLTLEQREALLQDF